jgi:hypothetical protein
LGFLLWVAVFYSTSDTWKEILGGFVKFGSVPIMSEHPDRFGQTDNVFAALWAGRSLPELDLSMFALLGALAAISGSGGLTNTLISAYTRDQGWGMGKHLGAMPSVFGGRRLSLSHVGKVFQITPKSLARFRGWYRVVLRDQLAVWMPACFIGVALPCMLSVQFLPRDTQASDWVAAGMTADGLRDAVGPPWGQFYWLMCLFCGFLVLVPTGTTAADGVLRRWVDVCWTAIPRLRQLPPHRIRHVYFAALCGYAGFGLISLSLWNPVQLLKWAGNIYNLAFGFSCFHVLAVNLVLLPRSLRPNGFICIGLALGGAFFLALSFVSIVTLL